MFSTPIFMNNSTTSRGHHPDSPSSLQSSSACPHFRNRNTDTEASKAGTKMHAAIETHDLSPLDEEEQVEAAKRCIDLERQHLAMLRNAAFEVEVIKEQYLPVCPEETVTDDEGRKWQGITGGYPDLLILGKLEDTPKLAILDDWKCGKWLVTPTKHNLQGKAYALAVLQKYPTVEEVRVQFFHPFLEVPSPLPEYSHTFGRDDMEAIEQEIRLTVALKHRAAREGWGSKDVPPVPHTKLCVFCHHLDTAECPAMLRLASEAHSKHEQLVVPEEIRPAYLSDPTAAKQVYQLSQAIEEFAKKARRRITDMVLTEGLEIEGMRVVTKSDRTIVSLAAVRDAALEAGVSLEDFEECLNLPITNLEKKVKALAPPRKGAAKVREFQQMLEDRGAVVKGKPYSYLAETQHEAIDV